MTISTRAPKQKPLRLQDLEDPVPTTPEQVTPASERVSLNAVSPGTPISSTLNIPLATIDGEQPAARDNTPLATIDKDQPSGGSTRNINDLSEGERLNLDLRTNLLEGRIALRNTRPNYTQQKTGAELLNMDPKTFDPNRKLGSIDEAIKLDAFHGAASQLMGDTFESRQAAARGAGLQYGASITAGNIGGNIGDKNAASLTQTVSGKYGSGFSTAPLVPTMKQSLGGSIASAAPKPAAPTKLQIDGATAPAAQTPAPAAQATTSDNAAARKTAEENESDLYDKYNAARDAKQKNPDDKKLAAAEEEARVAWVREYRALTNQPAPDAQAPAPQTAPAAQATAPNAAPTVAAKPAATAAATGSSLPALPTVPGQSAAPAQATAPNAAPTVATTPLRQKTALDTAFPNSALSLQLRPAAQTAAPNAAPTVATTPLRPKTALDIAFPNSALSLQLRPAAQTAAPNAAPNSMEGHEYGGMSVGAAQAKSDEALGKYGKYGKRGMPKFTTAAASEGIFELSNIDTSSRIPSFKRASSTLTASIQRRLPQITPPDHDPGTDILYEIAGVKMKIDPNDPATSLQRIGYQVKDSRNPTAIQEYQALVNFLAPAKA